MPIFITQGRYSESAMRGMLKKPEDRSEQVRGLIEASGGKMLSYYMTFGDYDFIVITEAEDLQQVLSALLVAGGTGGVTGLKTVPAVTGAEAESAMGKANAMVHKFRAAGTG